jgi:hypothetical protein
MAVAGWPPRAVRVRRQDAQALGPRNRESARRLHGRFAVATAANDRFVAGSHDGRLDILRHLT